jgi:hypothetical protein
LPGPPDLESYSGDGGRVYGSRLEYRRDSLSEKLKMDLICEEKNIKR